MNKSSLFPLLLLSLGLVTPVFAANVDQGTGSVSCTLSNQSTCGVMDKLTTYSTYVKFATELYYSSAQHSSKYDNFSSLALPNNPSTTQNAGAGVKSGNVTFTSSAVTSDHVEVSLTFKAATPATLYFYWTVPGSLPSTTQPSQVIYTDGQGQVTLNTAAYVSSSAALTGCSAPCAYANSANHTLILVARAYSPATVDVYVPVAATSVSCCSTPPVVQTTATNTQGGQVTGVSTTSSTTTNSTQPSTIVSCVTFGNCPVPGSTVTILIVVLLVAYLIVNALGTGGKKTTTYKKEGKGGSITFDKGVKILDQSIE